MDPPSTAIVWFRRDLRVHDHPALHRAIAEHDRVLGAFVLDDRLLHGRFASERRTAFMLGCLEALGGALRERDSGLIIRHGRPEEQLVALAAEAGASTVLWTSDVSGFARARDERVTAALTAAGVAAQPCGGNYVVDVGALATQSGGAYSVFSPFWRAWREVPRRPVHHAPGRLGPFPDDVRRGTLGAPARDPGLAPGEAAARSALARWLSGPVDDYAGRHDAIALSGTSGLSPYLRWGCLSPRECEQRALHRGGPGASAWARQLCWRDFFAHVLLKHPDNAHREHQERYRSMSWERDEELLGAWCEGRTGYPLVDAAMRQLAQTGWMHNRARMVVGSFLTKDLHQDWRDGEQHFERLLLDGEPAQNNGNWQWIASVGVDPAPAFRRMFNPTLQGRKFDPDGTYVRRWVPELSSVPTERIHDPSAEDRLAAGYPQPIVDHAQERRRALVRYGAAAG